VWDGWTKASHVGVLRNWETVRVLTPKDISGLIARVALGDRAAFDLLYQGTSAKLFGVLLRLLNDRAEAEDALQEVYVRIWQRADRYSASGASAMSWLIAIARNHGIDRLRARKDGHQDISQMPELEDKDPTPEMNAMASSERVQIDICLDELDSNRAQAVRGAYLEGYSYQELADQNKVPLNTMRTWLRRSLAKLRECLDNA